ncbi:MAG: hypothetical protein HOD92_12875 [Deltaproteobacteria bacterium]|nr:hypothetical protein [Deltaproteobacteria bacterium]
MPNRDGTGPRGNGFNCRDRRSPRKSIKCQRTQQNNYLPIFDQIRKPLFSSMVLKTIGFVAAIVPALLPVFKKQILIEDKQAKKLIDLKSGKQIGYQIEPEKTK